MTPEAAAASPRRRALRLRPLSRPAPAGPGQIRHASDNREELAARARRWGTRRTAREVAIVSGGDPGVFAMAAAVCEEIEAGPPAWRVARRSTIVPGVTAMLAVAARVGAPLGHDFCAHLAVRQSEAMGGDRAAARRRGAAPASSSRSTIRCRARGPGSSARPSSASAPLTCRHRRRCVRPRRRPARRAASWWRRSAEPMPAQADMATCVIVGSPETRLIERARPPAAGLYAALLRRGRAHDRPAATASSTVATAGTSGSGGRRSRITSMPSARAAAILP